MPRTIGNVRRSQIISTYGIGAMIPVADESFMVAGIDRWTVGQPDMHEPRLERLLSIDGFVLPPAGGAEDVPVIRFPIVHYCQNCRRLADHNRLASHDKNVCNRCRVSLVPSRFVVVCSKGHIDDFPYFRWVHERTKSVNKKHDLSIQATGASASLSDIVIGCSCGAERSMEGAFSQTALKSVLKCTGARPWLGKDAEENCEEVPRTLQRGASNTYFAIVRSSISIPPWSEGALKLVNQHWSSLRYVPNGALFETINGMKLAENSPYKVEDLVRAVELRKTGEEQAASTPEEFRQQEYDALSIGKEERGTVQDFVSVPVEGAELEVGEWFGQVMAVKRLREVRALYSFTRLLPSGPGDEEDRRAALAATMPRWLPAIEVQGEGIFVRLNQDRLAEWEVRGEVVERASKIDENYVRRFRDSGATPDRVITPRFLLIHTLAHALITQWSLDSGYPAASLRERLYVGNGESEMAGFLIYTATTDSAGSLGGIIARANPIDLGRDLREAVTRTSWCSADPLCIEADASGTDALNLAACHACALLPETSCEESNTLLDRGVLVGTPSVPRMGFFSALLNG